MNKLTVLFCIVFVSISVFAHDNSSLFCESPTSHFFIWTKNNKVTLKIVFPYGSRFLKISRSSVSASELKSLGNLAIQIKQRYTNEIIVSWPKENCIFKDNIIIQCRKGNSDFFMIPSLSSQLIETKSFYGNFKKIKINLSFWFDFGQHSISGDFHPNMCYQ